MTADPPDRAFVSQLLSRHVDMTIPASRRRDEIGQMWGAVSAPGEIMSAAFNRGEIARSVGVADPAATTGAAAQPVRRVASAMVSQRDSISADLNTFIVAIRAI